jgi:ribose/xylose/arabinose/galactoside ABC-type transport system permease subunit
MLSGFLAAMAGIMLSARLTVASADIGKEWGFYSFAAPVIGGVVGGRVSIVGTLIGGFLLATIETAIVHFGLDMNFNTLVKGGVIIIAVAVNAFRQTRMEKEK